MKNLIEYILNHIVSHPEDVVVDEQTENDTVFYTIHVHKDDLGKVIGKNGRIIKAIRQLVTVRAIIERKRVRVSLAEEEGVE